jgi:hypothetical protein
VAATVSTLCPSRLTVGAVIGALLSLIPLKTSELSLADVRNLEARRHARIIRIETAMKNVAPCLVRHAMLTERRIDNQLAQLRKNVS